MRRLLAGIAIGLALLLNIAATGTSEADAIAIAAVFGVVATFVYKKVPAVGHYMVTITVVASFVIAVVSELLSQELKISNLQGSIDPTQLLLQFMSVYGLGQFLFASLKQSPKTVALVTEPPVATSGIGAPEPSTPTPASDASTSPPTP